MRNTGPVPGSHYERYRELMDLADHLEDRSFRRIMDEDDIVALWEVSAKYRDRANAMRIGRTESFVSQGWHSELNPDNWKEIPGFEDYVVNIGGEIRVKCSNIVVPIRGNLHNQPTVNLLDARGMSTVYLVRSAIVEAWGGDARA